MSSHDVSSFHEPDINPLFIFAPASPLFSRVAAFLVFFTCTAIYFVELINSALLNPNIYANYFGIPQEALNGILPLAAGLTQILLFSLCPVIFRSMANIEGVASSMEIAEQRAIIFFWYFYVVARYLGTITWETVKQIFFDREYGKNEPKCISYVIFAFLSIAISFSNNFPF